MYQYLEDMVFFQLLWKYVLQISDWALQHFKE